MSLRNREVKIVYYPHDKTICKNGRCLMVGVHALAKYVTESNAKTAIRRAIESGEDKYTVKLRAHGKIDFYFK